MTMYTKCVKCKCELSSYLPFNANKKEWFCDCCEGGSACPTPKERTFEDPGGWDSFGMGQSFMPGYQTVDKDGTKVAHLPTRSSFGPAGAKSFTKDKPVWQREYLGPWKD